MPFYPPNINPEVSAWKDKANELPAPEGGGHIIDFLANLLAPQLNRAWGRAVEGKYEGQPWQTIAADALVPDNPWEEATSIAGAPAAAGMVRMGGKSSPDAYLHRALGDPAELDWLANLFQKGRSTQKPTSAVTPSVMSTFGSEPYGLLFNADASKGQIAHAGARDLYSEMVPVGTDRTRELQKELQRVGSEAGKASQGMGTNWLKDPRFENYKNTFDKIDAELRAIPESQRWDPARGEYNQYGIDPRMVDPEKRGLDSLFNKQRGFANKMFREMGNTGGTDAFLLHNEIIPNIDRSMLAGVRLPMQGKYAPFNQAPEPGLIRALQDFAEQQHVPIFRWPAEMTQAQQLEGLKNPFAGKWGYPPGRKDYLTSSMLKKIFGITELP